MLEHDREALERAERGQLEHPRDLLGLPGVVRPRHLEGPDRARARVRGDRLDDAGRSATRDAQVVVKAERDLDDVLRRLDEPLELQQPAMLRDAMRERRTRQR